MRWRICGDWFADWLEWGARTFRWQDIAEDAIMWVSREWWYFDGQD
jgi:hypothetical protein